MNYLRGLKDAFYGTSPSCAPPSSSSLQSLATNFVSAVTCRWSANGARKFNFCVNLPAQSASGVFSPGPGGCSRICRPKLFLTAPPWSTVLLADSRQVYCSPVRGPQSQKSSGGDHPPTQALMQWQPEAASWETWTVGRRATTTKRTCKQTPALAPFSFVVKNEKTQSMPAEMKTQAMHAAKEKKGTAVEVCRALSSTGGAPVQGQKVCVFKSSAGVQRGRRVVTKGNLCCRTVPDEVGYLRS